MAFRQPAAIGTDDQGNVAKPRPLESQGLVEEQLPWRRWDKVVAANDLSHALGGVIDDDGKLIGGRAGRLPDDEIAPHLLQPDAHRSTDQILKLEFTTTRSHAPGERLSGQSTVIRGPPVGTRAWIGWPFVFRVRRAGGALDVVSRAGARIDQLLSLQLSQGLLVQGQTRRLDDCLAVPVETQPAKIVQR